MNRGTPDAGASHAPQAATLATSTLATFKRRLTSLIYEALILTAVLLAAALPPVMLMRHWENATARPALQAWIIVFCGAFYVWQWASKGQTLPMKTWKMRLVMADGSPVSYPCAIRRYFAALASIALLGLGYVWALVDRDRQFLHDRLAGTRIVLQS